jgi:hypothetical protein
MKKVEYPKHLLNKVRQMIRMYSALAKGKTPAWVCLCDACDRHCRPPKGTRRTWICPAVRTVRVKGGTAVVCCGPGEDWHGLYWLYAYGVVFPRAACADARAKAEAWQAWLDKQKEK